MLLVARIQSQLLIRFLWICIPGRVFTFLWFLSDRLRRLFVFFIFHLERDIHAAIMNYYHSYHLITEMNGTNPIRSDSPFLFLIITFPRTCGRLLYMLHCIIHNDRILKMIGTILSLYHSIWNFCFLNTEKPSQQTPLGCGLYLLTLIYSLNFLSFFRNY